MLGCNVASLGISSHTVQVAKHHLKNIHTRDCDTDFFKFHVTSVSFLSELIQCASNILINIKIEAEIYKSQVKRQQPISKYWCLHTYIHSVISNPDYCLEQTRHIKKNSLTIIIMHYFLLIMEVFFLSP